jgi:hypothetical protein
VLARVDEGAVELVSVGVDVRVAVVGSTPWDEVVAVAARVAVVGSTPSVVVGGVVVGGVVVGGVVVGGVVVGGVVVGGVVVGGVVVGGVVVGGVVVGGVVVGGVVVGGVVVGGVVVGGVVKPPSVRTAGASARTVAGLAGLASAVGRFSATPIVTAAPHSATRNRRICSSPSQS